MNTKAGVFEKAYASLNVEQKKAVDTIEGPVMVIAGPGTGKTQILTLRIANILKRTDVGPDAVLALTFTEAGARAMRERLFSYIGQAAYRVTISTFHEFAGSLIRQYPDAYTRVVGGRPATDLEKVRILEDIINTKGITALRPHGNPSFYIKPIQAAISLMKREYITPVAFLKIIEAQEVVLKTTPKIHEKGAHKGKIRSEYQKLEKGIEKNRELLFIYKAYDAVLESEHLYDFDDMIFETVVALEKNEDMLRDLQERFQYILADEHQDVNGSQNRILELLASFHDRPNLFVVGDEKQAIYRFQGASLENFLFFEEKFSHTKVIALTENYRSVQSILDLSHALITEVSGPADELRVPLSALRGGEGTIECVTYPHEVLEDMKLVEQIESLISHGVSAHEIAILVRSNREVESFATLLRKRGIRARATADGDILNHPITKEIHTLLTAVCEQDNEEALFSLLHAPYWKVPRETVLALFRERSFEKPLSVLIEAYGHPAFTLLTQAREMTVLHAPHRVLEFILKATGYLDFILARDPLDGGRIIRRLYDEIESLTLTHETVSIQDVLVMFALRRNYGLPLTAPYVHAETNAVEVLTVHKSKGLEFSHVFLPHLTDDRWGDATRPRYFSIPITKNIDTGTYDDLDDERKLLYVGMTRAKEGLYLSSSKENIGGRGLVHSPLLESLGDSLKKVIREYEGTFDPIASLTVTPSAVPLDPLFLRDTLQARGLSATSLNNYLKSPWTYFYRNVLRIPEIQPESAQFGTALHNTMRSVTVHRTKEGAMPSLSFVKECLERELKKMPLSIHEYTRLHERGMNALVTYLEYHSQTPSHSTKEEYHLEAVLQTHDPIFPEVRITGNLDRLDFDEEGRLIRVVDYKSGKPKTRGIIEGTTKDSTGDYKRQLVFYMLLLSLQDDERLHTREGLISFMESDEKGKIHEELYTITNEEMELLAQDIVRVALEIAHGAFLDAPCDPEKSEYCELVAMLREQL